ncbi:Ser-Thr-rich GPI-anchored membrane family protein [Streptomyces sp. NPDC057694]|uniref:Ser-Thr-rich GPI-anchored membrane family protein n=1 Tax=unclassified Streptomyces TaxID=2593676 RepID=UPI00369AFF35
MRRTGFLTLSLSLAALPALVVAPAGPAAADDALTVTAPATGSVHRAGGSVFVTWRNTTGHELDMWLVHGGDGRVIRLAAKLSGASQGETATVLPTVVNGEGYTIELAARAGGARAYSGSFAVAPQVRAAR